MAQTPKIIVHSQTKKLQACHLIFITIAAIPIIWAAVLSFTAHYRGSENFDFHITRHGLVSMHNLETLKKGDLVKKLWSVPTDKVLNYHLVKKDEPKQPNDVIIQRGNQLISTRLVTHKLTWSDIIKRAWSHFFIVGVLVACSLSAALLAPPDQPVVSFFMAFISSAIINANDLTYLFGFSNPGFISLTYLTILMANWLMFSSWAHFSLNFPIGHQRLVNRPVAVAALYAVPPIVSFAIAYLCSDSSYEFWFWIHKIRRLFVPIVIIGSYIKLVYDFKTTMSPIVRNQLKYPLVSAWFGIGPYLFLFVIPILIISRPLVEYKWVILLSPALPVAFFMAMIQYKMMDVDETISKSLAYIILVGLLYGLYALVLSLLGSVFGLDNSPWFVFSFILGVGFLFSPAKEWIKRGIDRLFFKDKLEFSILLQELSQKITQAFRLSDLADVVVHDLPDSFRLQKACLVVLFNRNKKVFPKQSRSEFRTWPPKTIIEQLGKQDTPLLCQGQYHDPGLQQQLDSLDSAGYHLVAGLKSGRRMQGLICIGSKNNKRLFSENELSALSTLSNQITLALENAMRYEALKASTEEMKTMYDKMAKNESLAAIGEMTSILAHEIKTPLAVISSSAQNLEILPEDKVVQKELLGYIISEAENMAGLVDNLLGVARYKLPKFVLFNLTHEISALLDRWEQGDAHNTNTIIKRDFSDRPVTISGDPNQLCQVFLNLIRNSEDAMPEGGVIHIRILENSNMDSVNILIADTGPGITPDALSKIFKKFFSTKKNGLGLGLVLCKQIVQAHNGNIRVKNVTPTGVSAKIKLPRQPYPDQVR